MLSIFSKHETLLWRLLQVAFFVALLLAKSQFVTREDYDKGEEKHRAEEAVRAEKSDQRKMELEATFAKLNSSIMELSVQIRLLQERKSDDSRQNEEIRDHEMRLRRIENGK